MANKLEISLAGVNADQEARTNLGHMLSGEYWWGPEDTPAMIVSREPTNRFDPNALVCLVNDRKIGYVPAKFIRSVDAFMAAAGYDDNMPFRVSEWGVLTNKEGLFCVISLDANK